MNICNMFQAYIKSKFNILLRGLTQFSTGNISEIELTHTACVLTLH